MQDSVTAASWTSKIPKMAQPDLNFMAPEVQLGRNCCPLSDMFSLGMLVCALYNAGHSLIAADHNPQLYVKQLDQMHDMFGVVAHKMPMNLVDPVEKMINKDVRYRPSAQLFSVLKYFSDPVAISLHALACTDRRDPGARADAYASLSTVIPQIPRKVMHKHVLPILLEECKQSDSVIYALPTLLTVIDFATRDDYCDIILSEFCAILNLPKPVQATVYILNRLDVILSKTPLEEVRTEILPMVFNCLDSSSLHAQEAAIGAIGVVKEYLDDSILRKMVLPKAKSLFFRSTNVKMRINALSCIDHLLESLDKMLILDDVLPFLTDITCQDPDVVVAVVSIYKHMLSDKKFGLTHNLLATKVMPSLIPHTVNPGLNLEQFSSLMEVLRDMLDQVDKQRRNKMKLETVTIPVPHRGSIKMQTGDDVTDLQILIESRVLNQQPKGKPAPSTPELPQRTRASSPKTQRKNHSLQTLGMSLDEKGSALDKPVELPRRHSLIPPGTGGTPTISITSEDTHSPVGSRRPSAHSLGPFSTCVSGFADYLSQHRGSFCGSIGSGGSERSSRRPSTHSVGILPISMFGEGGEKPRRPSTHSLGVFCFGEERGGEGGSGGKGDRPRRLSTHSLGPLVVPDMERRGSKTSILGSLGLGDGGGPPSASSLQQRRPSFQALGESMMHLFSGK
ncbi:SCY1-like protein 2 [Babylonia areolata]|uniref:SCY1-like protein 2 n=1 Tax=Babylonia areolata TaxID=304850 RepID=UPI003FD3357B